MNNKKFNKNMNLDLLIAKELKNYNHVLTDSLHHNIPFKYLDLISNKYLVQKDLVYNKALDFFNFFVKEGVSPYRAKFFSLYYTHKLVIKTNLNV